MNRDRMERAQFAAEVRRKGTLLSSEGIEDVCEALLELIEDGAISLELHEEITSKLRKERDWARMELLKALLLPKSGGTPRGPELDEVIRNGGRD